MPNMFGGDSSHPAYKPRELAENEVLLGDVLWTIDLTKGKMSVFQESIEGRKTTEPEWAWPSEVKDLVEKLKNP